MCLYIYTHMYFQIVLQWEYIYWLVSIPWMIPNGFQKKHGGVETSNVRHRNSDLNPDRS